MANFFRDSIAKGVAIFIPEGLGTREERKFDEGGEVRVNTDLFVKSCDEVLDGGNLIFIGRTPKLDASLNEAVWQIQRKNIVGGIETKQFAQDNAGYVFKFTDRDSLFGALPTANTKSINFDGVDDRLDVSNDATIDFDFRTEPFTLACWIKTSSNNQNFLEKMNGEIGYRFHDAATQGRLTLELRGTGNNTDRIRVREGSNNAVLSDGGWHLLAATYSGNGLGSGVALYIDGAAVPGGLDIQTDGLSTDTSNVSALAMGSRTGGGTNYTGNMDEPAIWNIDLTSAEISEIYNSGVPIDLLLGSGQIAANLVSTWRMGDDAGDVFPTIVDVKGSNDATMVNMDSGDIELDAPP